MDRKLWYFFTLLYTICNAIIHGFLLKGKNLILYVDKYFLLNALTIMRYSTLLLFTSLTDITVIDYIDSKDNRFEINYILWNYRYEVRIMIRIYLTVFETIPTVVSIYKSADWLEREIWDLYGIKIIGHHNLRRILTDYGFKGHPLRKDFPVMGYTEILYDDIIQSIKILPLEISQVPRFFKFDNPWKI